MKRILLASTLAASVALSACATNPYGYNNDPYYKIMANTRPILRAAVSPPVRPSEAWPALLPAQSFPGSAR